MKRIIALALIAVSSAAAIATGVIISGDQPQSGSITLVGDSTVTNSFQAPYYTVPPIVIFSGTTNVQPFTNNFVTVSNFSVTASATNGVVQWQAYVGYPRVTVGTNAPSAALAITNTFPVPYAYPPSVSLVSSGASTTNVAVSAVTATTFIITKTLANTNETVRWTAIGEAYAPGSRTVTY